MNITAHHDSSGKIHSLLIWNGPAHKKVRVTVTPKPGLFATDIEGIEVPSVIRTSQDLEAVRKIMKEYVVSNSVPTSTLKKKK